MARSLPRDGEGTPVLDTAGKQVNPGDAMARFCTVHPNGDIRSQAFKLWVFKGLDAKGYPLYEFPATAVAPIANTPLVSPYDFKTKVNPNGQSESAVGPDGEFLATLQAGGKPSRHGPEQQRRRRHRAASARTARSAGTCR